jgi:hypothetical protein
MTTASAEDEPVFSSSICTWSSKCPWPSGTRYRRKAFFYCTHLDLPAEVFGALCTDLMANQTGLGGEDDRVPLLTGYRRSVQLERVSSRLLGGAGSPQAWSRRDHPDGHRSPTSPLDTMGRGAAEPEAGIVTGGRVRANGAGRPAVSVATHRRDRHPEQDRLTDQGALNLHLPKGHQHLRPRDEDLRVGTSRVATTSTVSGSTR